MAKRRSRAKRAKSVAARKASVSRNSQRRARSLAAKKGWRTRRANQKKAEAAKRARTRKRATTRARKDRRQSDRGATGALPTARPYRSLDDFIAAYDEWEGDYDYYEIETNADY